MPCPFCEKIERRDLVLDDLFAVAISDAHPLNPGHSLVLPRRHEPDFFKLTRAEEFAMWRLLRILRDDLENRHAPEGYNIGINVGSLAGQTIDHVHVHLIPRYRGDVDDPRGGIRWIIPARAPYWKD